MDSINQQQPEENRKDLQGAGAQEKIKELTKKADTCFFCTEIASGQPFVTRPMALKEVDESGALYFLSASDSNKNAQIAANPTVQILLQGSDYSDFLSLTGMATISRDKEKIKELWNPFLKVWFTEGEDDPRITVIKVQPEEGYYWDTKNPAPVGLLKRAVGAVIGKTLDDSIEGTLKV